MNQSQDSHKNKLRVVEASYVISAPNLAICPEQVLPELAIAGRSNVGKSSLINLICNRRNLAKTSGTPGKTRMINFFHLRIEPGNVHFHLVDLPGYGFSKAGKALQAEWGRALQGFLENRPLRGILHLIDSRHKPSELDQQMREWITHKTIPAITILTKTDKLKKNEIQKSRNTIAQILHIQNGEPVILTSVTQKKGTEDILQEIVKLIAF